MFCRKEREADLAGGEVDVGVAYGGDEGDFGRGEGVGGWDGEGQEPEAAGVGG